MNYAVVDLPVLSNAEQCADACMRLKAEYLYQTGQYNKIKFQDDNGQSLRYSGGASGEAFYRCLRRHLIRNLENPFRSPWFISDGNEKRFLLSITPFKATGLRHY